MNDHFCTTLVTVSGDPGAGTAFHEFSGRLWTLCKRNVTSEKERDHSLLQTLISTNWKSR